MREVMREGVEVMREVGVEVMKEGVEVMREVEWR